MYSLCIRKVAEFIWVRVGLMRLLVSFRLQCSVKSAVIVGGVYSAVCINSYRDSTANTVQHTKDIGS